jgi:transposase
MEQHESSPQDWREWRRLRAWRLSRRGWGVRAIAEALGASPAAVSGWLARARRGGPEALAARPHTGGPTKLAPDQVRLIADFLWHGPEAYGFRGEVWTCGRVAKVLAEEFGVSYSKGHVSRILKGMGWTPQVPITRAVQRDEEAIERWRSVAWPELQALAGRECRALVFVDEAGFYLLPAVVRTYAPRGLTPTIYEWQTRDHLSVMGALTPVGKVYTLARQEALNGLHSVEFLEHLLRQAGPRLLVIWDRSPIHRRAAVKEFAASIPRQGLRVEFLPAYAPDLNPVEWLWRRLKRVELRNRVCLDLEELHTEFHLAIGRVRPKTKLLQAFFTSAGLML